MVELRPTALDDLGLGAALAVGMRERLALVGGTLFIESSPAGGTTVRATIALA